MRLGEKEAVLSYTERDGAWDIKSVIVPEEFRGKGIAEKLTKEAFRTAKEKGVRIIPTCPYVKDKFLEKHKEFD